MPLWLAASAAYFGYVALVALFMRGVTGRARLRALSLVVCGALAMLVVARTRTAILHIWVLPPLLLLLAYWATGTLFVSPMPKIEQLLLSMDDRLGVRRLTAHAPPWLAAFFEFAYAGVYPLIPIALILYMVFADPLDPARFWAVILITDYICFGTLPWFQTRPPRSLEACDPWRSVWRCLNVRVINAASIRVNTFPSGHAAEALAVALLVLDAPTPWVAWMFFNAAAISAAAVLGRYHYAVDVVGGWIVALVVWWML
jgi:membrane-associated phospholipid phosphatase